ncbi:MAG: fibronectin type III-like domain-contianing protein, partial [Planctomycetes bacterium]|nr:fibronectin type III-like domain-contianing protein [Planctomycetota bacterium]
FGDDNPGGKLPYTVYESVRQIPPQTEYDITKGFTYLYFTGQPLFPFGHGLSYTTFAYRHLELSAPEISAQGKTEVRLEVENTGQRSGDEVVQLYVHAVAGRVKRPLKELRGFQRVHLQPGEKRRLTFSLPADQLAFYDVQTHSFVVDPGSYNVLIGSSSADIRLTGRLKVIGAP